jgi:hypothetical protein
MQCIQSPMSILIADYRLPIGPIKVGRPRGANLGSMGNNAASHNSGMREHDMAMTYEPNSVLCCNATLITQS